MQIQFCCPSCDALVTVALGGEATLGVSPNAAECPVCKARYPLEGWNAVQAKGFVSRCVVCEREHFYCQRDFNRNLGLGMITVAAVISLILYAWSWFWSVGFLAAVTVVDLVLYRMLPQVTVCYVCGAVYRRFGLNPEHYGFDLHQYEVYTGKWKPRVAHDG